MKRLHPYIVFALSLAALLLWSVLDSRLPVAVFSWYCGLSAVALLVYGWDKFSAKRNWRRTPEKSLHVLSVAGGWPGALLGQQVFRHKTSKRSFQRTYWATVAINCLGLVALVWSQ